MSPRRWRGPEWLEKVPGLLIYGSVLLLGAVLLLIEALFPLVLLVALVGGLLGWWEL